MSPIHRHPLSDTTPLATVSGLTRGTLIKTATGPRAIETLKLGDMIQTRDAGMQPLRSISRQKMLGTLRSVPVRIASGVIGNTSPLIVGPMQRILCTLYTENSDGVGRQELTEARCLVNGTTITREEIERVEYLNLGFDDPQIIYAEDALAESDLPHTAGTFDQAMAPHSTRKPCFAPW